MGDNKPSEAVSNSNGSPSYTSAARVIRFRQELRSNTINLVDVSKLAYEGVPDKYGLRPLVWKVSLLSAVAETQSAASLCATQAAQSWQRSVHVLQHAAVVNLALQWCSYCWPTCQLILLPGQRCWARKGRLMLSFVR